MPATLWCADTGKQLLEALEPLQVGVWAVWGRLCGKSEEAYIVTW